VRLFGGRAFWGGAPVVLLACHGVSYDGLQPTSTVGVLKRGLSTHFCAQHPATLQPTRVGRARVVQRCPQIWSARRPQPQPRWRGRSRGSFA
jgi:hypothetical protein